MSLKLAGAVRCMLAASHHLPHETPGGAAAAHIRREQGLAEAVDVMAAGHGVNLQLTFFADRKVLHLRVRPAPPERPCSSFGADLAHSLREFGAHGEDAAGVSAKSRVCQLPVANAESMVLEYTVHLLEEALSHPLG